MYKVCILAITIVLIFTLCVCAYADETEIPDTTDSSEDSSEDTEAPTTIDDDFYPMVRSLSPVTPSDATGLKSAILSILGNYDPVVVEYRYESYNGSYSYLREIQPDYVWIWSCIFLGMFIFCLFRLLGGIFNAKRH